MIGSNAYADLVVHTAMTSTFGIGGNVPTSYSFFPGDGIHWHFLFYFYTGVLNYLGFPIDYAINIPSILSMVAMLILLGSIATLIAEHKYAFFFSILLSLFRGGFDIFILIN